MDESLRRFRCVVEYDGTDYAGFQFQNGPRSVQEVLEKAVGAVTEYETRIHGSGRTDAGVHALGQVVHFDSPWRMDGDGLGTAINAHLPRDIAVRKCVVASSEFHSRFDATGRLYQYLIWNAPVRSALWDRFAWHLAAPLDIEAMQGAAVILSGRHDFRAFGKPARQGLSTVRLVRRIRVRQRLGLVVVSVEGNAFLRHMVRAMVGTLVAVGRGKLSHDAVSEMIRSCDPAACPPVAPPRGLCLLRVNYAGRRVVEG